MTVGTSEASGAHVGPDANSLYLAILQVSRIITYSPSIDEVYESFALELKKLVDFDRANITAIDAASGTLAIAYNFGQQMLGFPTGRARPLEGSRAGLVMATRTTFIEHDVAAVYPRRAADEAALKVGLRSSIVVPLICQGQVIGALSIRSRRVGAFGFTEQVIIEHLARLIAPAVDRMGLSERVSRLTNGRKHRAIVRQTRAGHGPESDARAPLSAPLPEHRLSPREQEVLALLTSGAGNREIGTALSISTNTVKSHVGKILGKLEVRNRTEAARALGEGWVTRRSTLCTILALATTLTLGACVLDRGGAPNPRVVPGTPNPTIAATPRLVSTPLPPPTPTPVTRLGRAGAERLVWEQVRSCAEAVARSAKAKVEVEFTPAYGAESGKWLLEVSSPALGLSFGRWEVEDATGQVAPGDQLARGIARPDTLCQRPEAFVAGQLTPPLLVGTAPATTPTPTPSAAAAELLVWTQVRRCAGEVARDIQTRVEVAFRSSDSAGPGTWLVEAFSDNPDLDFGRWQVDVATGGVTPLDQVAQGIASPGLVCVRPEAFLAGRLTPPLITSPIGAPVAGPTLQPGQTPLPAPAPTPTPLVATAEQARVRVWASVRPCFEPPPPIESFAAYQDRPRRWIVEGRVRTTSSQIATLTPPDTFGLWVVNADTGETIPGDDVARRAVTSGCIRVP